jgi:hypothetical protein
MMGEKIGRKERLIQAHVGRERRKGSEKKKGK